MNIFYTQYNTNISRKFYIFHDAELQLKKASQKNINDILNGYSLHPQVKLKSFFFHIPKNDINKLILVH